MKKELNILKNITLYIEFTENPDCKSLKDFTGFCLPEKI